MSQKTWESIAAALVGTGIDALQGIVRIALIVAVGYVIVKLLRTVLKQMEELLIRATERT